MTDELVKPHKEMNMMWPKTLANAHNYPVPKQDKAIFDAYKLLDVRIYFPMMGQLVDFRAL